MDCIGTDGRILKKKDTPGCGIKSGLKGTMRAYPLLVKNVSETADTDRASLRGNSYRVDHV